MLFFNIFFIIQSAFIQAKLKWGYKPRPAWESTEIILYKRHKENVEKTGCAK